jgi:peptidoglycan/xylan/chitin deacetylase (PgdA/CDA1 family)
MSIRAFSVRAADFLDRKVSRHVPLERPGLLGFVFHSLFEDRRQVEEGLVHPQEGLTKADLRRLLGYFLENGYEFVSAAEIEAGLRADGRFVHVTFDDGYANNLGAVSILEELGVAATIFVTTAHVETGDAYWWDVLYRERRRRGAADGAIDIETEELKTRRRDAIDAYLRAEFGAEALRPVAEVDRPLTRTELEELARHPLITIGNHTRHHAILTRLGRDEVRAELEDAQSYLGDVLGARPRTVAYPNGDYDPTVLAVAKECGLELGVTVDRRKNRVGSANGDRLAIARYVVERDVDLVQQLDVLRGELQLANFGRRLLRKTAAR